MLQRLRVDEAVIIPMPESKLMKLNNECSNLEGLLSASAIKKITKHFGSFPNNFKLEVFDMAERRWVLLESKKGNSDE